jgi:hypothetical protein
MPLTASSNIKIRFVLCHWTTKIKARVFDSRKLFCPSLIFEAWGPCIHMPYYTRPKRIVRVKHSSLFV